MRGASSSDEEVDVEGEGEGRRREDEDGAPGRRGLLVDDLSGDLDRFTSLTPGPSLRALISF